MLISEIFYSVQGEGILTGVPSVFVRTSGCNLRCRWCDTPYASWKPEGERQSPETILSTIQSWPAARHVVLTGGEPMVAKGAPQLIGLIRNAGYHLTIETAGTIPLPAGGCDLASISPKLANSTPLEGETSPSWIHRHEQIRFQPDTIRGWMEGARETQLKFVISSPADFEEARELMTAIRCPIAPDRVLLMPEGRTMEELRERSAWLVEVCKTHGHRFCHRLHIELFGNKRGT
ncbi:MAG: radical protein [Verrucomicrobiales bacterium]|nr:radical protein [Verrucomicrobiales bacterium]